MTMQQDREARGASPLGARLPRFEDDRLLRGAGRFVADLHPRGLVHAVFVRSPIPHGDVLRIGTDRALRSPGVLAVLTAADLPHAPLVDSVAVPGLVKTPQPALAGARVTFVGEPVALVLARSRATAEDAAELVEISYREREPVTDPASATTHSPLHDGLQSNEVYAGFRETDGVAEAFDRADHVVSARFVNGRLTAAPMEGRACLAEYDAVAGLLTVHASTQSPHLLQRKLAACLQMTLGHVRVRVGDVGGGFGQKIPASPEEVAVALAARATGRPVRWVEDRAENLIAGPQAKDQHVELRIALDADGTFRALRADVLGDAGAYSFNSASALIEAYLAAGLLPGPYRIREVGWTVRAVLTNKPPVAPYRGVGWTAGHTARELLIDRAARLLGRDPVDLRRQNLLSDGAELSQRSATGMVYDSGSFRACLDRAAALVGADRLARGHTASGRYRGLGISPYVEPSGWGSAGAGESSWSFASHDSVRLTMAPSGEVTAAVGTPSQGQGHATSLAQVVAAALGCRPQDVTVVADDTATVPASTAGTRASRVVTVVGGALIRAGERLRELVVRIAAHLLECRPEDVEVGGGLARVRGTDVSVTFAQVAAAATYDPGVRAVVPEPDLQATAFYDPPATYSNGCIAVVVEVDPETGGVNVTDAAAVEDCGTRVNPMLVEGQTLGAFAQGVGAALYEEAGYGDDGGPTARSFGEYLLPTAPCLPRVRLDHRESPSPVTLAGIKGMGESAMIATPGAVACAVADALAGLGVEIDRTPVTPEDLATRIAARTQQPHGGTG